MYLDIKIPHLQIAHQGGNLEVENIKIHPLASLRSMAGMHWAVCRLCNFSRRPLPNLESTSVECGTTWNQPPPKPNLVRLTAPPATSRSRWPLCAWWVIVFVSDLCVCVPRPQKTCPKIDFIKNYNHRNMIETIETSHEWMRYDEKLRLPLTLCHSFDCIDD